MENSYKFYANKDCKYFPCHEGADPDSFNCMFCYCPLFLLKDKCGGNFTYLENGVKDCSNCMIPHSGEAYEYIMEKSEELMKAAKLK